MGVGLVEQLVSAGLVTAAQASASHAGDPLVPSGRVLRNLVNAGLDERVLAGFFISRGFGPMLQEQDLRRADQELVRRLPASDAHDLCAMPLRPSPAGAIVAMADPTDAHAVARLGEALGGSILPTVAKLSDLLASIDRAYPPDRPTLVSDPLALARSRIPSDAFALTHEKSEVGSQPTLSEFDPAFSGLASTASPVWDRAWHHSTTEREVPLPSPRPAAAPATTAPAMVQHHQDSHSHQGVDSPVAGSGGVAGSGSASIGAGSGWLARWVARASWKIRTILGEEPVGSS